MYNRILNLIVILLLITACNSLSEVPETTSTSTWEAIPTVVTPSLPSPTVTSTITAVPPTATPLPTNTPIPPADLSLLPEGVFLYPGPDIYAGDKVTFQVLAYVPQNIAPDQVTVHILVDNNAVATGTLGGRNLAGDAVGLFQWAWNTTGAIGVHQVEVVLDQEDLIQIGDENPDNNQIVVSTLVADPATLTVSEANATWVTAEGNYCILHVVTGTAAYRDLTNLVARADSAIQQASRMLGEQPQRKLDIYLIDRVIGQGGYAGSTIVISYLDRQYSGEGLEQVLVHEATHILDRQFAPQRITFMAEGLAVWASGGHYKPEDLDLRAAALVESGRYMPLADLINNFYPIQHEIGYLEAAGFVKYLIDQYGWSRFRNFYSDITPDDAPTLAEAVDVNLQTHYSMTLQNVEAIWLNYLAGQPLDNAQIVDLETTIRYYDVMRDYQIAYDPTAYFLTAWLPHPHDVEEQGNPADLTRHPRATINITLEVMLQAADTALRSGDYQRANILLDSVNRVLENDGAFIDPLAVSYLQIVNSAAAEAYEVQRVTLNENQAIVLATKPNSITLTQLILRLQGQAWVLSN